MPAVTDAIYLNTAAFGLIPASVSGKAMELQAALAHNSSRHAEHWKMETLPEIRKTIAAFLAAQSEELALLPNFSFGINCVVQALKGTEKILLYRYDYPSLTEPFLINNFDVTWIDSEDGFNISMEEIAMLIEKNGINMIAISHVQWLSGFKIDLKELGRLCRQHGVLLIIDATQSAGALPIAMADLEVDVLIFSNYKWMNAGLGTGVMYMASSFLSGYPPVVGGHNSYILKHNQFKYEPSVHSYEPGHLNMTGLTILESAILAKQEHGLHAIADHNDRLTRYLLDGIAALPLQRIGPLSTENRCAILLLKDENGLGAWLNENRIITTLRNHTIRISMHYYNTQREVDVLIDCLKRFASQQQ